MVSSIKSVIYVLLRKEKDERGDLNSYYVLIKYIITIKLCSRHLKKSDNINLIVQVSHFYVSVCQYYMIIYKQWLNFTLHDHKYILFFFFWVYIGPPIC